MNWFLYFEKRKGRYMRPFSVLTLRQLDRIVSRKRKNHPARWFFEGSLTGKFMNRGNSLVRDMSPNPSFQCSLS